MTATSPAPSARKVELTETAYRYVLDHGMGEVSLRPLAAAIGSSPRVLLFLFGSKDELIRALLARAREDELAMLQRLPRPAEAGLEHVGRLTWAWLSAREHRPLLTLWVEAYARSLIDPDGPWAGFARQTVQDWLDVLSEAQPRATRNRRQAVELRTGVLALLRGALLDLLATGDVARTTASVHAALGQLGHD